MRVVKDPVVRKNELLDAAEHLFTTKGYDKTSISDIVKYVNVAKGTFYYYFESKDEILDEVLLRLIEEDKARMRLVLNEQALDPVQKIILLMLTKKSSPPGDRKERMMNAFHELGNAKMNQREIVLAVKHLAPILAEVVQEGVEQGVFSTTTPLEDIELLLSASSIVFDEVMFPYEAEELITKSFAFSQNIERVLGAKPGAFEELPRRICAKLQ